MWTIILTLLLPLLVLAQNSSATPAAQNATAFALGYGYPLLAFQKFADRFLEYNITNTLAHARQLSTADNKTVVKPNVDTLYSTLLYDLSNTDLSLTIPHISPHQFALFSFYDPYGDNYANLGSGQLLNQSGQYLLSTPPNASFVTGAVSAPSTMLNPQYPATVYSPTTYGLILIRWLVNATNLDYVHSLQDNTTVQKVNATGLPTAPLLTTLDSIRSTSSSPAQQVLNLLAQFAPYNRPQLASSVSTVSAQLKAAGLSNDSYTAPPALDLNAANASAVASSTTAALAPDNNVALNNGWSITRPGLAGNFDNGTAYAYRTAIAATGYLMLQAPIAVFPSWRNASNTNQTSRATDGSFSIAPNDAYLYSFSRKPPLKPTGFWSITAYENNYLIPNDLNRYALGDRSNLTYSDGTPVYADNDTTTQAPFQILLQVADNPPPDNWTSNWLPAPQGGGNVTALLRWYNAQDELLDGSYEYPVVERITAISKGGNGTSSGGGSGGSPTSSGGTPAATSSSAASPISSTSAGTNLAESPYSGMQTVAIAMLAIAIVL